MSEQIIQQITRDKYYIKKNGSFVVLNEADLKQIIKESSIFLSVVEGKESKSRKE